MEEEFRPESLRLIKLPIPVPPMLESALGYPGDQRYVAFHECRATGPGIFIEDPLGTRSGVEAGWSLFCKHPAIVRILDAERVDLRRGMPVMQWDEWIAMPESERLQFLFYTRSLLLDRQRRKLWAGFHWNVVLFLRLQPKPRPSDLDDDDEDELPDEEFQPQLKAADPQSNRWAELFEDMLKAESVHNVNQTVEISHAVLENLRRWLDEHEPLDTERCTA